MSLEEGTALRVYAPISLSHVLLSGTVTTAENWQLSRNLFFMVFYLKPPQSIHAFYYQQRLMHVKAPSGAHKGPSMLSWESHQGTWMLPPVQEGLFTGDRRRPSTLSSRVCQWGKESSCSSPAATVGRCYLRWTDTFATSPTPCFICAGN